MYLQIVEGINEPAKAADGCLLKTTKR